MIKHLKGSLSPLFLLAVAGGNLLAEEKKIALNEGVGLTDNAGAKKQPSFVLRGHKGWVAAIAFSPDGRFLASGGEDETVKLWSVDSGKMAKDFGKEGSAVTALAFSPDGRFIATGFWNGTVKVRQVTNGKETLALRGHGENVTCLAYGPKGKLIASGSGDDTLKLWDAKTGKELLEIEQGNEYDVTCLAFSPDGKRIVTGDGESELKVWEIEQGDELMTLNGHDATVSATAYSPDGKFIASGSQDNLIKLWDDNGNEVRTLRGHTSDVTAIAYGPKGEILVSCAEDKTARVWDARSGKAIQVMKGHTDHLTAIACSLDGKRVAVASKGVIKIHTLVRNLQAKDSPATERIRALEPNQAVLLGEAKVVGDFNAVAKRWNLHKTGPRGRDFTIKMVWAPERKRVLFCGANHGVPHRLNDVWEFDLSALTWFMLYAPDNPRDYTGLGKDFSDVEFKDGILITKRGGPAIIAHTWWGLTYDPKQKMMLFMNTWVTNKKKMVELLGGDPDKLYVGPPLWGFSPESGQWEMFKTPPPAPRPIFGGWLEYVPELKGTLWHANNWQMRASWLFDAKAGSWKNLQANGSKEQFQEHAATPEQVGYYDPKRRILVAQRHKETFHYTPATNEWEKVLSMDKESKEVPYGHDAYSPMYHDPVSGHGLLVEFKTNALWAYDPDRRHWTKLNPAGDPMPTGKKRLAYFDPSQKVFVIIEGTTVWAYRYKSG